MSTDRTVLLLHGWGGNKPAAWQEWLYTELTNAGVDVRYPKMPNPATPSQPAWLSTIHDAVKALPGASKVTVLCHSLGAISWMHYSNACTAQVADRVLLVAPPYVSHDLPPADTPPGINGFFPVPLSASAIATAARETSIVCGENDCYGTEDQLKAYADKLEIPMNLLPGGGHVSPYWGYGEWPWVLDYALGNASLPPLPKA